MNCQTNINIRTDKEIKVEAEKLFESLGLNMSTAINIFLRQAIIKGGIPFEVKLDIPNETTIKAIEEGRKILNDSTVKSYKSIEELRNALE